MIGKTPPVGPSSPQHPEESKKTTSAKKFDVSGTDDDQQTYKSWGGMNFTKTQWTAFMSNILKSVSQQIQDDMQKSLKALQRIKDVAEGNEPDD